MLVLPEECVGWTHVQRPGADYLKSVEEDFKQIEPYLPENVESILDIGCGMAGIDVYLKRKFPNARLELLDGDGKHQAYGFRSDTKPYSSRVAAEKLLEANGVKLDRWHEPFTKDHLKAGLVISLISWGFHYPLNAYKVSGFCIADLRRPQEPARGTIITKTAKYDRCAFTCA